MQIYKPFDYDENIDITQILDFDNLDKQDIAHEILNQLRKHPLPLRSKKLPNLSEIIL